MKYCKDKHSFEVSSDLLWRTQKTVHFTCMSPGLSYKLTPPHPTPPYSTKFLFLRHTLPPLAYSTSLEQCLAKPAGLRRQRESPEGWTIRQFQDHEALNQSRQGTLIKQPSPAQPTNPHRAIKSIPSKTLWNLSGENCRGVRERRESGRDGEGRGGKYHKILLEKKNRKKKL